jgi:hypothetical protein
MGRKVKHLSTRKYDITRKTGRLPQEIVAVFYWQKKVDFSIYDGNEKDYHNVQEKEVIDEGKKTVDCDRGRCHGTPAILHVPCRFCG